MNDEKEADVRKRGQCNGTDLGRRPGESEDEQGRRRDAARARARAERLAAVDAAAEHPLAKFERVWGS